MTRSSVQIKRGENPIEVARIAADLIANSAAKAVAERGRFTFAMSGGSTPKLLFEALSHTSMPWQQVHIFQVDERVAPDEHPDRNATDLSRLLISQTAIPENQVQLMPVTEADLETAADSYAVLLRKICGTRAIIDLVHLGLGNDGHTASLVPNDPLLHITDRDVAMSLEYQGRARMTLTRAVLDRAKQLLWVVTGQQKQEALAALLRADQSIPAGLINQKRATLVTDQ